VINTGYSGGLYLISEWIMRLFIVNVLWLLFNIPILFLIVNLFFVQNIEEFVMLSIPVIILLPVLFFPATAAMFATVRCWIVEVDDFSLLKTYWKFYKSNYKISLLAGVFFAILLVIWSVDVYYFSNKNTLFFLHL